jgi:hypothetical protein
MREGECPMGIPGICERQFWALSFFRQRRRSIQDLLHRPPGKWNCTKFQRELWNGICECGMAYRIG